MLHELAERVVQGKDLAAHVWFWGRGSGSACFHCLSTRCCPADTTSRMQAVPLTPPPSLTPANTRWGPCHCGTPISSGEPHRLSAGGG